MRTLTLVGALLLLAPAGATAQVVGGCETPVAARTSEVGCYLVATHALGELPAADVFWHIYIYPTLAEARAVQTARGTVVQSHGKVWLYTIAEKEWRSPSGERKAVIGPLAHSAQTVYTARYMEATIPPVDGREHSLDTERALSKIATSGTDNWRLSEDRSS